MPATIVVAAAANILVGELTKAEPEEPGGLSDSGPPGEGGDPDRVEA